MRGILAALAAAVCVLGHAPAARAESDTAIVDELDEALSLLIPDGEALRGKTVVLDEVSDRAWLTLHATHPAVLRSALAYAMSRHGMHIESSMATIHDPTEALRLLGSGEGVLLFRLESDWGEPHVRLWLMTRAGGTATDLELPNNGLVSLSWWRILLLALLCTAPISVPIARGMAERRREAKLPPPPPPRYARAATPAPVAAAAATAPVAANAASIAVSTVEDPLAGLARERRSRADEGVPLSDGALAILSEAPPPTASTRPKAPPHAAMQTVALADTGHALGAFATAAAASGVQTIAGRYRVVAELGRGAMGVVYRAHDENLEREVAIKALSDTLRDHPDALRLFSSEAKALAQLNHTNIVSIYDQVADRTEAFLVMELVDGTTLDSELQARKQYPWRDALGVIDQLCAGLAYAHGKTVIHRDIKPANIFITRDGAVKLGDFGLARVVREVSIRKTEVRGTPLYMSPEQINGTDIDARSDLYAVGCTLFELLAGRPPFIEGEVMFMHLYADPAPVTTYAPDVPAGVAALVASLLAKAPADRPANAGAVRATIRELLA